MTSLDNLPKGVKLHSNGILYKELEIPGLDEPLKIFNTIKPARLKEETYQEYAIRRKFVKRQEKLKSREVWYCAYDKGAEEYKQKLEEIKKIKDPEKQQEEFYKLLPTAKPYVKNK